LYVVQVPKGHVWTEGDNQADSLDSRAYGCVSLGLVEGIHLYDIVTRRLFSGKDMDWRDRTDQTKYN